MRADGSPGGLFAKKIDIAWSTAESGLLLGISLKCINFRDETTKNYQKNLTNRRGDLAVEAVTLHRRFPYAVLAGFLILDKGAKADGTDKRNSTFFNAFPRLRIFTGRSDPSDREAQQKSLYIMVVDANQFQPITECYLASDSTQPVSLDSIFDDLVGLTIERNFDFYESDGNNGLKQMKQ